MRLEVVTRNGISKFGMINLQLLNRAYAQQATASPLQLPTDSFMANDVLQHNTPPPPSLHRCNKVANLGLDVAPPSFNNA